MNDYARARRRYLVAWVALLALLAASATLGHMHLGIGNLIASLGIAAVKCALVVWIFMAFDRALLVVRLAFIAGLSIAVILPALSLADFAVRRDEPARWQAPEPLSPVLQQAHAASSAGRGPGHPASRRH